MRSLGVLGVVAACTSSPSQPSVSVPTKSCDEVTAISIPDRPPQHGESLTYKHDAAVTVEQRLLTRHLESEDVWVDPTTVDVAITGFSQAGFPEDHVLTDISGRHFRATYTGDKELDEQLTEAGAPVPQDVADSLHFWSRAGETWAHYLFGITYQEGVAVHYPQLDVTLVSVARGEAHFTLIETHKGNVHDTRDVRIDLARGRIVAVNRRDESELVAVTETSMRTYHEAAVLDPPPTRVCTTDLVTLPVDADDTDPLAHVLTGRTYRIGVPSRFPDMTVTATKRDAAQVTFAIESGDGAVTGTAIYDLARHQISFTHE